MDVQPRHLNHFPSHHHLLANSRELIGLTEVNDQTLFDNGSVIGMANPNLNLNPQPIFVSSYISDSVPPDDHTGLTTCNLLVSRKRSRDSFSFPPPARVQVKSGMDPSGSSTSFSNFLGEDVSLEFQQQQLEIDQLVAMHAEQMKLCIQERRNRVTRGIVEAVEQEMVTKLRERDEEIAKIGQINWALQERVKTLCHENQLWKDLAHRNEMAANALKSKLEHMLLDQIQQRKEQENQQYVGVGGDVGALEFNESFCSSNSINGGRLNDETEQRFCTEAARSGDVRVCRRCGTEESSVLLLPCRHLCVCSGCGSSVHTCPICHCTKNGSVNINLSSF